MKWSELPFWSSEDWEKAQEKLNEDDYCPGPDRLFRALDTVAFDDVKVAIVGQDPYPNPNHATGLAFSVPKNCSSLPMTLRTIFKELRNDLGISPSVCGDLTPWCSAGVLLWNSRPSCRAWQSLSHDWPEWKRLTDEIIERLCRKGVVIVLVGRVARQHAETVHYYELVNPGENILIEVSHPSPRAKPSLARSSSWVSFVGSRIFSRINDACVQLGYSPVDWRLRCSSHEMTSS